MTWPVVTREHREAVGRVLDSGVFTEGREVAALEAEFAEWAGRRYAVAVSSGTAALECALLAADEREWDAVGVPAYTFSGSALGAAHIVEDLIWPDVDPATFVAEAADWEAVGPLDVAVVVHLFGQTARLPDVPTVIEDCAQAFGNEYVGRYGLAACWSFNQSKTVWAGEGGIVATDDEGLADECRSLRCFGGKFAARTASASNWKLAEIPAALARVSLGNVDLETRLARERVGRLSAALSGSPLGPPRAWLPGHVFHQCRVTAADHLDVDALLARVADRVPVSRWQTVPLPSLPAFGGSDPGKWPGATFAGARTFTVGDDRHPPCVWSEADVDRWADLLLEAAT